MDQEIPLDNQLPPSVQEAIRDLYAPPGTPFYWEHLEARVMGRVRSSSSPGRLRPMISPWTRGGVLAAAILLATISFLFAYTNSRALKFAYDSVLHRTPAESLVIPSGVLTEQNEVHRETFRDVISH